MDRVTIFGDSVMKGVLYDAETGRYHIRRHDLGQVRQSSFARMGAVTPEVLAELRLRLTRPLEGAPVLLGVGGNDSDFDWDAVSAHPEQPHGPRVPLDETLAAWQECVSFIRAMGGRPVAVTCIPIHPVRYFDFAAKDRDEGALLAVLGEKTNMGHYGELYSLALRDLAGRLEVPLADARSAFLREMDYARLFCADGIHPSVAGYELMDQVLRQSLRRLT